MTAAIRGVQDQQRGRGRKLWTVKQTLALSVAQLAEAARKSAPATEDDVSITQGGRRLTSRTEVLEFLAQVDAQRGERRDAVSP